MMGSWTRSAVVMGFALVLLAGCGSSPNRAPVEDRGVSAAKPVAVPQAVKPAPGFENVGKPGFYTVKPGDTLIRIGLENGHSHQDLARWNALENPNRIEVGQVLRLTPPSGEPVAKPVAAGTVTSTPIASAPAAKPAASAASAPSPQAAPVAPAGAASAAAAASEDDLGWIWPAAGPVIQPFEEARNNGIAIGGSAGDSVVAVADGRVIWAGMGEGSMRNYGNLIIIQHNKTWISAYANNQSLLVKEEQRVRKGQKIAEMGNSGTDKVKLHFELRRMGKAQDPTKYLPAR